MGKHFPFLFLLFFAFFFTYDHFTGKVFFSHNDYSGMYYPFRQWFLSRLMNLDFPLWNPYWGIGHEAVIWSTVPLDPYTFLEIILGARYGYFYLIQCSALLLAGYFVFRKLSMEPWAAAMGSLFFFLSPITTFWYFEFIKTNFFIAHMFAFLCMVKFFDTGNMRYALLLGWAFFLGMFGTKLEFWFFGALFYFLCSGLAYLFFYRSKPIMILIIWASIGMAVLAQSWQMVLLVGALENSNRTPIPHGLHNLFSPEMYRNLALSIRDSDLFPVVLSCISFLVAFRETGIMRRFFAAVGLLLLAALLFFWQSSLLFDLVRHPLFFGAAAATVLAWRIHPRNEILFAWALFILPAFYWCRPLQNADEMYLLRVAPVVLKGIWGFLVWLGCLQLKRHRIAQLAYACILLVLVLEAQGQILLAYLFGYLWMPARDNYLIDFSFSVMAVFGTLTYFRHKKPIMAAALLILAFSSYPNLYYMLPKQPVPGYANPLLKEGLSYDPFSGVPELREIIRKKGSSPSKRALDPDIEQQMPQNQGTFLLEKTGNASFYGSMTPKRYSDLVNLYRYGIKPNDAISGYPSVYAEKTISRLPRTNMGGFSNGLIYYMTVWTIPPIEEDLLRLLGIDYVVTRSESLSESLRAKGLAGEVEKHGSFYVSSFHQKLPRAFLVTNVTPENLDAFTRGMRPRIALESEGARGRVADYMAIPAWIVRYDPESVSVEVDSTSGGYLVLTDAFHPYWRVKVDGKPAEMIPAFHAFRAVQVKEGIHTVEFFCRVPFFTPALLISILVVLFMLSSTLFFWKRKLNLNSRESVASVPWQRHAPGISNEKISLQQEESP
jgi:hypothetical protein